MKQLWASLRTLLRHQYRFILVDETTHQRSLTYAFSVGQVLRVVLICVGILLLLNTSAIVFTPVREWIPGYTDPKVLSRQSFINAKLDSMAAKISSQDSFISSLQRVSGYSPADTSQLRKLKEVGPSAGVKLVPLTQAAAPQGPAPAMVIARQPSRPNALLFWPVRGKLTSRFDARTGHFAIDIAAPEQLAVRAVADGTVILTEYSEQTGYVIGLQHPDGLLSFYKHNAQLFKPLGGWVRAGEAIAAVGNSGTHTTGPHVHFELWVAGKPVDPLSLLPATQ